jgi:hypothetical protein
MRNYTANKLRGWDLAWPDLARLSDVHARRDSHRAQRDAAVHLAQMSVRAGGVADLPAGVWPVMESGEPG